MMFNPKAASTGFLNAAACVSLVGGAVAGLAIGSQTFGGDFFSAASTWVGWAFFACGFAGFAILGALSAIVDRLTSIRYMLSLQIADDLAEVEKTEASPAVATSVR